ncbi:atrial natriuretic peptide-converting enzyme isoform X20 [Chrysemys picta bellii]|uniref:atrial natriuretic peptide-converting enzyme isoform X20 n=1 Tax=Chrysemys picta bellii TaxID=8478 RepID=UPI0032B18673
MFSMQQFPALPPEEERYRQVLATDRVLGTDEDNMGDGCSQKLASAKYLRLLLLILIPCICALILLLVFLLTFVGILEKTCFYSNGSDLLAAGGNIRTSDIPFPNIVENSSDVVPTVDLKVLPSSWTQSPLSHVDQMHENLSMFRQALQEDSLAPITPAPPFNPTTTDVGILTRAPEDHTWSFATTEEKTRWSTDTSIKITDRISSLPTLSSIHPAAVQEMNLKKSACINITYSQCQMLPYNHTTLTSVLSIVKSIEMEKFLKFFSYLNRLSCYQHIMLFGCSLALPECISDGDDSRGLLPCRSFCEAAKEGCEPVLGMVNSSWPEFLRCSQFQNRTENDNTTRVCFSPWQERGKQLLCGGDESFLCASGICIPGKLQCNGYNDCDDWSDEAHCNCSDDVFRCTTGKCLNYTFVCDGYDDCGDLSDEQNCDCNPLKQHRCGDGRCITVDWVCDGDHDCIDKSDEVNCSCYSQGLVECKNGQCIPSAFQCDGDNDCKDGSDEDNCSENKGQTPCQEGDQRCIDASCPDSCGTSSFCDINNSQTNCSQCEPITLELCMNLPYNYTNYPNYLGHRTQKEASISWESSLFPALVQTNCYKYLMFFACTILVPKCDPQTNQRIPPCRTLCEHSKERCESVLGIVGLQWPEDTDCTQFPEENSDNRTCLTPDEDVEECSPSHFKCRSGRCVLASRRCDGQADCEDDSDEDNCDCGRRPAARMSKRILGGRTSRPGRWPWQCSLQSEPSGHICGCVLIANKWVLTVAHCFEGETNTSQQNFLLMLFIDCWTLSIVLEELLWRENAAVWKVVFGINNLDHPSIFMQTRLVKTIILHPRYNRAVVDYDISIVELNEDINETSYVRPVCLPSREQLVEPDTYCYITGWGHMGNKNFFSVPFKLQEGEVRIISLEQCQSYFDMKTITSRMLCAGYESGTVDSCMGDSGGPLVCEQPAGRWTLFGLTSWGSVCFSKVLGPGVYSNVSHFTEWIERQIYIHTFLLN